MSIESCWSMGGWGGSGIKGDFKWPSRPFHTNPSLQNNLGISFGQKEAPQHPPPTPTTHTLHPPLPFQHTTTQSNKITSLNMRISYIFLINIINYNLQEICHLGIFFYNSYILFQEHSKVLKKQKRVQSSNQTAALKSKSKSQLFWRGHVTCYFRFNYFSIITKTNFILLPN